MRVLIIGGTVFVGRHVAAEALRRGHDVTIYHRGLHGADLFPQAERIRGDREGNLSELRGRAWDAVIDTCGYQPSHVAATSRLLADAAAHLVFISSISVYRDWPAVHIDEESALHEEGDDYGALKVACEREAEAAMPGRVAQVRAGLIVGPHDNIFRLPWWVARVARGGEVVGPGRPTRELQLIGARDMAAWMLDLGERRTAGVFNATAPPGQVTFAGLLDAARSATGSDARVRWVDDDRLKTAGIEPWTEMPLWMPEAEYPGTWTVSTARAQAAGLRCRPVEETVADVAAWLREGGEQELPDWKVEFRAKGLAPERERELLAVRV